MEILLLLDLYTEIKLHVSVPHFVRFFFVSIANSFLKEDIIRVIVTRHVKKQIGLAQW